MIKDFLIKIENVLNFTYKEIQKNVFSLQVNDRIEVKIEDIEKDFNDVSVKAGKIVRKMTKSADKEKRLKRALQQPGLTIENLKEALEELQAHRVKITAEHESDVESITSFRAKVDELNETINEIDNAIFLKERRRL